MAEPYLLRADAYGLMLFTTSAGIEYAVSFLEQQEDLFPLLLQLQHRIFSFSFFLIDTPAEKPRPDERIMPTIVKAIRDKFADDLNVLFVVEDSDERQDGRWRMFEGLHAAARHTDIQLLNGAIMKGEKAVMSALLVHTANPYRNEVAGQFFALLAKLSKD